MGGLLNPNDIAVLLHGTASGTDAAATVTLAATANTRWQVLTVFAGFGAAVSAGETLTISWTRAGVAQTFTWYMPTATGTQVIPLSYGSVTGDDNTAVTITLTAGGVAIVGTVDVFYGGA